MDRNIRFKRLISWIFLFVCAGRTTLPGLDKYRKTQLKRISITCNEDANVTARQFAKMKVQSFCWILCRLESASRVLYRPAALP
ncbi:uncharacterized protein EV420DRAFT_92456 [Desarmillaria tabescens]|uniref:Uncharacterized protein n=1 Tax=Armillaria tabescens TaxID=1929756 RepID=A0AA39TU13_ARMTA|nr:uncharacterized protein EV420DRAFT_92456 [Desarmillaria tabescens]KAK0470142.1 hypothetical protein EV420DRAFT_92456 [Desarmillaria tabescens]